MSKTHITQNKGYHGTIRTVTLVKIGDPSEIAI